LIQLFEINEYKTLKETVAMSGCLQRRKER